MGGYVVEITRAYRGSLRMSAHHGPSGADLDTDAPVDNNGKGEAFSPTDLVATALGTCICTIIAIAGERRGLDLSSLRYRVTKEMVTEPPRRIGTLVTTIWLPASLSERDRTSLERAARGCPVHRSLAPEVEAPIEFVYE